MSDNGQHQFPEELNHIYAALNQQDVEQFYAGYQLWWKHQRIAALQEELGRLRLQISENEQRLQQLRPPAVAFATLARLQAKGVNDIDLLDRMLERGEEWLDLTMQRLDYCEQLNFIHDNYTQWCEHALEGAYDWIDSLRDAYADTEPRPVVTPEIGEAHVEATEELLLRKLTSEEEEAEEPSWKENTLKRQAVSLPPTTEVILSEPAPGDDLDALSIAADQGQGLQQELSMQVPEMAISAVTGEADTNSSLVSSEQVSGDEYIEFPPPIEAGMEEAGSPEAVEMSFPIEAEADVSTASSEQAKEDEYVEFAPSIEIGMEEGERPEEPSVQEGFSVIEELISAREGVFASEVDAEEAPSPVAIEQGGEEVESVPSSLPTEGTSRMDTSVVSTNHDEPRFSKGESTQSKAKVQLKRLEYRKRHLQQQEAKPQRRRRFWRRLLADIWP